MLSTPLPELALTLTAQDDTELSRLIGDPAGMQLALLARSRFFAAVTTLAQMQSVNLAADVLDYLRRARSSKFWNEHSDETVSLIMQDTQKLIQAKMKKKPRA